MAVIFIIISFSNSDILDSKWQIFTLLLSFVKYLIRAASENFRSACLFWDDLWVVCIGFYYKFITNFTRATTTIFYDYGLLFCDHNHEYCDWIWMLDVRDSAHPPLPWWGLTGVGDGDGSSLRVSVLIATCNWLIACCYSNLNTDRLFSLI